MEKVVESTIYYGYSCKYTKMKRKGKKETKKNWQCPIYSMKCEFVTKDKFARRCL